MPNPRLTLLRQELLKEEYRVMVQAQDYPAISAYLNSHSTVANPSTRVDVPKIPTIDEIYPLVPETELFAIAETETYKELKNAAAAKNMTWILGNLNTLKVGGLLSQTTYDIITSKLQETEPDPNYRETTQSNSKAETLGFSFVTSAEVQSALLLIGG